MKSIYPWMEDEAQLEAEDEEARQQEQRQAEQYRKSVTSRWNRECDSCKELFPFAQKVADRGENHLQPFRPASGRGGIGQAGTMNLCPTCLPVHIADRMVMPVRCTKCKQTLPADNFLIEKRTAQPIRVPTCHDCRAFAAKRKNYGITRAEYHDLLAAQGGTCAICGGFEAGARGRRFYVDHCHRTGMIRGLLCQGCNHGLGQFDDNPAHLERAARYVRDHANLPAGGRALTSLYSVETTSEIVNSGTRPNEAYQPSWLPDTNDREDVAS